MLGVLFVDHPDPSALSSADLEAVLALARHGAPLLEHAVSTWQSFADTRLRDRLLLHHPPSVVEQLTESRQAERARAAETCDVTVLAAAVTIRDRHAVDPPAILQTVTHVFNVLCDSAFAEGGSLVRFDGDVAVFVFGSPLRSADHADRALRAAEAMCLATAAHPGGPEVLLRLALDTGPSIVAIVDAGGRHVHVVLGDVLPVLLGPALSRADGGGIVVTSRTRNRLTAPPDMQPMGPLGTKQLELYGHRVGSGDLG
jgi:class 3 adenylate cyclase